MIHVLLQIHASGLYQVVDISGDTLRADITKLAGNFFLAIVAVLGAIALFRKRMVEVLELAGLFVYKPEIFGELAQAITTFFIK